MATQTPIKYSYPFWREYFLSRGFDDCRYGHLTSQTELETDHRFKFFRYTNACEGYIFKYGNFSVCIKPGLPDSRPLSVTIQYKNHLYCILPSVYSQSALHHISNLDHPDNPMNPARTYLVTWEACEEMIRLCDAVTDGTGSKLLCCLDIPWSKFLVSEILKEGIEDVLLPAAEKCLNT